MLSIHSVIKLLCGLSCKFRTRVTTVLAQLMQIFIIMLLQIYKWAASVKNRLLRMCDQRGSYQPAQSCYSLSVQQQQSMEPNLFQCDALVWPWRFAASPTVVVHGWLFLNDKKHVGYWFQQTALVETLENYSYSLCNLTREALDVIFKLITSSTVIYY